MREITISFKDKVYTIPAYKAFQIGEEIETIASLAEMAQWQRNPRFHKIARCYGTMLRFAGAKVRDDEVFTEMLEQVKALQEGDAEAASQLYHLQAIQSLMAVLMDGMPEMPAAPEDGSDDAGKKTLAS